jgi:2-aminomuconate deaminase
MTGNDIVQAEGAPAPVGAYPHARRAGDWLILSGIGPRPADGGPIPGLVLDGDGEIESYDIEAQCHAVFANVRAVLESAGASWDDLVDITVFLTNIPDDFATYNRIYAEYFDAASGPCRTTVEISRLPTPIAIELKCLALAPRTAED